MPSSKPARTNRSKAPQQRDADDTWRVAVHEAAHAVVAHVLDVPLGAVSIVPGRTLFGDGYAGISNLAIAPEEVSRVMDDYSEIDGDDLRPVQPQAEEQDEERA